MRAKVEVVVRDEVENILSQLVPHEINLGTQSLHDIEGAVETWRQQALPQIEADLLTGAQNQFTHQIKNQKFNCNGTRLVWIKTIHGKFVFSLQKYQFDAQETNYLTLTNQLQEGYLSPRLQELCGYYSNRNSYDEVALLVERISGERLLSDQKIGQIVSKKALQFSQEIYKSTSATLVKSNQSVVKVNPIIDIYQPASKEILLFDDGIQVKRQKEQRKPKTISAGKFRAWGLL